MSKNYSEIEKLIADADVVLGVYPEATAPDGNGTLIIKGKYRLKSIVEKNQGKELNVQTVPCECIEEAEALRQTFGDGKVI
jgi:hypothetical protein